MRPARKQLWPTAFPNMRHLPNVVRVDSLYKIGRREALDATLDHGCRIERPHPVDNTSGPVVIPIYLRFSFTTLGRSCCSPSAPRGGFYPPGIAPLTGHAGHTGHVNHSLRCC